MRLVINGKLTKFTGYCTIDGCGKPCCGKYCYKHEHQIRERGHIYHSKWDYNEIEIIGDMAKMFLYDNYGNKICYTIIDADDVDKVRGLHWHKNAQGYAVTQLNGKQALLHRFLCGVHNDENPINSPVDHINRNRLDNRKANLRLVSSSQNSYNRPGRGRLRKGVCINRQKGRKVIYYQAYINVNKKQINLGYFHTYEEAVVAREDAEKKYGVYDYSKSLPQTVI